MRDAIIEHLRSLNREFYQTFATSFSETRARLQPGVLRTLEGISLSDSILDLGCGNGGVAYDLAQRGHTALYYGLDNSPALLEIARQDCPHTNAHFYQADLAEVNWSSALPYTFDQVFAFAVLHHIPGEALRIQLLRQMHDLLAADGRLTLSNWNFPQSPRLQKRVLPWTKIGIEETDVDPGDALLDWKRGGLGLRYVHHFSEAELDELA